MNNQFDDWNAICKTKARYCRCMDTKDWEGYTDCFTEDYVLDTTLAGGYRIDGRAEAVKQVRDSIEAAKTAQHVHNPEITFDDEGADVIWAMQDRVEWDEQRAPLMGSLGHTGYGHYKERWIKCTDGNWRIKTLALSYLHFDIRPLPKQ